MRTSHVSSYNPGAGYPYTKFIVFWPISIHRKSVVSDSLIKLIIADVMTTVLLHSIEASIDNNSRNFALILFILLNSSHTPVCCVYRIPSNKLI